MDDRILYLVDLINDDELGHRYTASTDDYGRIVVYGDYFDVYANITFVDDFIDIVAYQVFPTRDTMEFYSTEDVTNATDELNFIVSQLADWDGSVLMM